MPVYEIKVAYDSGFRACRGRYEQCAGISQPPTRQCRCPGRLGYINHELGYGDGQVTRSPQVAWQAADGGNALAHRPDLGKMYAYGRYAASSTRMTSGGALVPQGNSRSSDDGFIWACPGQR